MTGDEGRRALDSTRGRRDEDSGTWAASGLANQVGIELTAQERQELIRAVEPWQEFSAAFYVDHYLAPAVLRLMGRRLDSALEGAPTERQTQAL
jgi:hypothetical protein